MGNMQLNLQMQKSLKPKQDLGEIGLDNASLIDVLSQFDLYGVWRLDVETGMTYWSRDVFIIHNLPFSGGPVDIISAINAYHPEDRAAVSQCLEEALAHKSGFRFVLRLGDDITYKLVKATGKYRENAKGKPEIYGTFSQFQPPIRSVAINDLGATTNGID